MILYVVYRANNPPNAKGNSMGIPGPNMKATKTMFSMLAYFVWIVNFEPEYI